MVYRDFKDKKLSLLGFGAMRLPTIDGDMSKIDESGASEMVDYAIKNGINYFDTAYGYHSGNSETVLGKLLRKYPRDSYYIATKFPGYAVSNMEKVKEIFEDQLEKTGMDYFDFYLFHNVSEHNIDGYLNPEYGVYDHLIEMKNKGIIRHLGFSTHGTLETMRRFLDAYGRDMEFCQIQLNWLDWDYQSAGEKVALLNEYNIPVWVMEPVRGGRLARLADSYMEKLDLHRDGWSAPEWALRFAASIPEVKVILSGMSNMEQLKENIETLSNDVTLNENEFNTLFEIASDIVKNTVPCTSCRYCVDYCPQRIDIPRLIRIYNQHASMAGGSIPALSLSDIPRSGYPEACAACRSCEAVCPQNIKISDIFADFASRIKY